MATHNRLNFRMAFLNKTDGDYDYMARALFTRSLFVLAHESLVL